MAKAWMRGEKKPRRLTAATMTFFAQRLLLERVPDSAFIFVGDCPLCGGKRTLHIWQRDRHIACSACGLDGGFGAAPEQNYCDRIA
jgi:Zn ribbon nucleic-acid-binding protein